MIGGLGEAANDLGFAPGVEGGIRDDFLEEVGWDEAGTGEGEEDAARPEEFEREQVDVFVAARRALNLAARFRELGRVEDDEIELAARVAIVAQDVKDVAGDV